MISVNSSGGGGFILAAFSYRCYGDPVSSDVGLKYSLVCCVSLSQAHRSAILWILPAASAAAPPVLKKTDQQRESEESVYFLSFS